jgi:hypothetical protein
MKILLPPLAVLVCCLSPVLANAQVTSTPYSKLATKYSGPVQTYNRLTSANYATFAAIYRGPAASSLSQTIIQFGLAHLGRATTEPGQSATCANFVGAALHAAHAKSTEDYGVTGMNTNLDYVWGTRVVQHSAGGSSSDFALVKPGDVIQFRNVNSTVKTTQPNGSWSTQSWSFPQHTAIVYQNLGGGRFTVLQQNADNRQYVTQDTINLSGMTSGTLWVYRPVAK